MSDDVFDEAADTRRWICGNKSEEGEEMSTVIDGELSSPI
jgi:hypothetical protein